MPRELIYVTRSASRLTEATRIEPGYPKDYTPEQMRMWADDMDRVNRTPAADLDRMQTMPRETLSPEEQRMMAVHDKYCLEPADGIKGTLREDGKVELDGGRHRAGYMLERGVDPIPVWVSAPDQRQLDALRAQCDRERAPARTAPAPRTARAEQARERADRTDDSGGDRERT